MLSSFRSRGFFVIAILVFPLLVSACVTGHPDRSTREKDLTATLTQLLPDGRILSNDLSVGKHRYGVSGAWLFDSQILVQSTQNDITALDRQNLQAKWAYMRLGGPVDFPPSVSPVSVLMIAHGVLHEVDRWIGNQLHVFPLDFVPAASPAATGSTAYIPSLAAAAGTDTIAAINLADGLQGWGISTRGSVTTAPVVGGTALRPTLFFLSEDDGVFAYPAEGAAGSRPQPLWMAQTRGRIVAPANLSDNLLLVGSEGGDLWAFDRITGQTVWVKWSGAPITHPAWAAGDQVYFRNPRGFFALSRADGSRLWSLEKPADFLVRRPEAVYLTTAPGVVIAVDPKTGETLRTARFDKNMKFLVNQTDATFYALTPGGFLFAVGLPIG